MREPNGHKLGEVGGLEVQGFVAQSRLKKHQVTDIPHLVGFRSSLGGIGRWVSEGQRLKLFIPGKKKGEAAKWPGCAIIFRRGEDCALGSLLGVACAVQATEG